MPEISTNGVKVADSARTAQATILEVPVTIQGSKSIDGQRELFTETTKTTLVFERGAVVSLKARVQAGQCVFVRNEMSGREILCKVAESRPAGDLNYTDLEFTAHDPKFWEATPEQVAGTAKKATAQDLVKAAVESLAPPPATESIASINDPAPENVHTTALEPHASDAAHAEAPSPAATETTDTHPEPQHDAEPNETQDAEHLAALIAMDDKSRANRESTAGTAAKEVKAAATAAAAGEEQQQKSSNVPSPSGTVTISEFEMRIRTLVDVKVLKNPIVIGIAASFLIAATVGIAWQVKRSSAIRAANRTAAAAAQAKQQRLNAVAQPSQTPASASATATSAPAPATQASNVKVADNAGVKSPDLAVARGPKDAKESSTPAVISVAASIPGSDRAIVAKPKHRKAGDHTAEDIVPAKIVAQSQPGIPQWAKGLDTDGVVQLDALIDEKGNVKETKVLSGPRALQREAERVVALWMFEPATEDGKPTATHMVLTVQFQM
jgi:TonB family protein